MCQRVYNLTDRVDRVQCLAASVALYRLFASLLNLAPDMHECALLYKQSACANSTDIIYIPSKDAAEGTLNPEATGKQLQGHAHDLMERLRTLRG